MENKECNFTFLGFNSNSQFSRPPASIALANVRRTVIKPLLLLTVIGVLTIILTSCAPLRPLAPMGSYETSSKTTAATYDKNKVTGIDAWDKSFASWMGTPYKYGGTTKSGVDCSGFVTNVYREVAGKSLPRSTEEEYKQGRAVDKDDLNIGDLVFFGDNKKVEHVGIYVGKDSFIHASTSVGVTVTPFSDIYWKPRYIGARRYL